MSVIRFLLELSYSLTTFCLHEKAYEYKITKSSNPADGLKDLDQYVVGVEENDDIRLARLHAAAAADISATSSIQITKSGARSTSSRKKKAKASKVGPTSGMRSKVQAALADQASLPRIDNKSFHDVHRAEGVLGTEHPSTLGGMNNLASVLSSQGKYGEAEEMHG